MKADDDIFEILKFKKLLHETSSVLLTFTLKFPSSSSEIFKEGNIM